MQHSARCMRPACVQIGVAPDAHGATTTMCDRHIDIDGAGLCTDSRAKQDGHALGEGPQKLVVLGSEIGGCFDGDVRRLLHRNRLTERRQLCTDAASGWTRRRCSVLSVAVQHAVTSTALGQPWLRPPHATSVTGPPLDRLLDLAKAEGQQYLRRAPLSSRRTIGCDT